jgi:hypothetical protein
VAMIFDFPEITTSRRMLISPVSCDTRIKSRQAANV